MKNRKVLITGADGFIGKNLCAQLQQDDGIEIIKLLKTDDIQGISKQLEEVSFIFHLAGINRPENESEFMAGNFELTKELLKVVEKSGKKIPIVFTSSTQAELDNLYGKSKKLAEDEIKQWSERNSNSVYIFRLTNVFGKWCKPNYNSVVATFCYSIANDKEISISDPKTKISLVYIDDVIQSFLDVLNMEDKTGDVELVSIDRTFETTLQQLADKIYAFKCSRETSILPSFEDPFSRFLYATYTSYLDKNQFSYGLEMKHDNRGWLSEFLKSEAFGQIFISKTKPGITRGNHWHNTKIEKFLVVEGEAEIKFRDFNSKKVITYKVSGKELKVVDIPAGYTHSITNIGETELTTLFWADEIFDTDRPDTYFLEVE